MAAKYLTLFFVVAVVAQGYAQRLTEVTHPDQTVNYTSHPFLSRVISIPKFWFETLLTCQVVFPNGITYEVFPVSNVPYSEIDSDVGIPPFNSCSIGFIGGIGPEFSGTYELKSLIEHEDGSMTLANQRFHVRITMSDVPVPL